MLQELKSFYSEQMANWRYISIFLLVVYLDIADQAFVEGRDSRDVLNENRKLPKAKGTIKTIECPENGDVIDCIDFWKQPAFNNPLTKKFHESIQHMEPQISYPGALNESAKPIRRFHKWNKYGECPKGTIPIKRTQKNNNATILHRKHPKGVSNYDDAIHEYAIVRSPPGIYHGAQTKLNLWNPYVATGPEIEDLSLAQIWVISHDGGPETLNSIEAGWIVYPNEFHTTETRRFIYSTSNGYETGCYNAGEQCPGFVVEHTTFSFDCEVDVSTYEDDQYEESIHVIRDPATRSWHLEIDEVRIGYWPANHFTSLADGAKVTEFGGEIAYHPRADGSHTTTVMGSGYFAEEGWEKAAYFRNIMLLNENYNWEHLDRDLLVESVSHPNCYNLDLGRDGSIDYTYFYYGGPGGPVCDRG